MIKTAKEQLYAGEAMFQWIIQDCAEVCEHRTRCSVNKPLPSLLFFVPAQLQTHRMEVSW